MADLKQRGEQLGAEHIKEAEAEWPRLIAEMQAAMDQGTDPADARVQQLARRWKELVEEFTGGDPGIGQSLGRLWQEEPTVHGKDAAPIRELMGYVGKAWEAGKTAK